ncbi:MAG: PLP-dependent transferase, partial [Acidimicrobiia bacterium]|nr:PLP-dependent transferase [Acidimicrobiia bacterium]
MGPGLDDQRPPWAEATALVRGGLNRTGFDETAEALFLTSGYVYHSAAEAEAAFAGDLDRYIYSRYGNPTVTMFEERLRILEGAEACRATASGMAAVFAALACYLNAGDRVVGSRALFGSCFVILDEILPRWGIDTELIDGTSLDEWDRALANGARAVFLETPSNPSLELIDLVAVCERAHAAGAIVVVDNVFATPVLQKPLDFGADVVVYSATKHIDGQGRTLGGAVLGSEEFISEHLVPFMRHTGPSLSPFNAWVLTKGLETLRLRVDAQSAAAHELACRLENGGRSVRYPYLASHPQADLAKAQMGAGGTILTIDVGDKDRDFAFV